LPRAAAADAPRAAAADDLPPHPPAPRPAQQTPQNNKQTNKQRLIIYPAYIDALKTVAEGRRIPRDQACPEPHVLEMRDAAAHLGLPCEPEDKAYPRDWLVRGRLRVALFEGGDESAVEEVDEDGRRSSATRTPYNPEITTRRELLVRLADLVRRHPSQIAKSAHRAAAAAAAGGQQKAAASQQAPGAKRKRGTVKPSHMPMLDDIAAAHQAMQSSGGGPMGGGEAAGPSGEGGGGGGGAGGGGGGGKKSAKKGGKKK
jgi:signal recognition particle subunit SRP19